jgi:hypothetical protein
LPATKAKLHSRQNAAIVSGSLLKASRGVADRAREGEMRDIGKSPFPAMYAAVLLFGN